MKMESYYTLVNIPGIQTVTAAPAELCRRIWRLWSDGETIFIFTILRPHVI